MRPVSWKWIFLFANLAWALSSPGADNAMERVNWQRAQKGLPAFIDDPGLFAAASAAADYRAQYCMDGHTRNDFAFLPAGVNAPVAGCARWNNGDGFGACELYSRYKYAGCAWVVGNDGRVYCHAFYSNSPSKYVRGD